MHSLSSRSVVTEVTVHCGSFPFVAAGTLDGNIVVWRCPFLDRLGSFHGSDGVILTTSSDLGKEPVVALAFHPTLPVLAAADANGHVVVLRLGGHKSGKSRVIAK